MNKNLLFFKKVKSALYVVLLSGVVVLTSCSDEDKDKATGSGDAIISLDTNSGVKTITRSDTEEDSHAPAFSEFKIHLQGNLESKTLTYEDLEKPISLLAGSYTVKAVAGDTQTEGCIGVDGYEKPWYQAEDVIEIKATETITKSLTATLQNAKVSVNYTEDFLNYFQEYTVNVSLKSSKGDKHFIFDTDKEYEPLYLLPGTVKLNMDISNEQGLIPHYEEEFTITGQSHYFLTFDIEEDKMDTKILITFVGPDTKDLGEINLAD